MMKTQDDALRARDGVICASQYITILYHIKAVILPSVLQAHKWEALTWGVVLQYCNKYFVLVLEI